MDEDSIRDLNLSADEISKLSNAFTNDAFKELFTQYIQEINDPENLRVFENEISQLERNHGHDIQIVKPLPNYSLKTNVNCSGKIYINICSSESIGKVTFVPVENDNVKGVNVLIPHSLSPVQKIYDKRNTLIRVYTVVYHPDTLEQAATKTEFRKAVEETAFSVIEKSFNVILDKVNYTVSKKPFKGSLQLTTIKKKTEAASVKACSQEDENVPVKPSYRIKYRNDVDLQNSRMDRYCKMNVLIPTQMIIEIDLPLLKSVKDTRLDIQNHSVKLENENPCYKLNLSLPYEVDAVSGKAKFDSNLKTLKLELDVKRKISVTNGFNNSNMLVMEIGDEVKKTPENVDGLELFEMKQEDENQSRINQGNISDFLNPNVKYKLPTHFANYFENRFAFTMTVRNVKPDSFKYRILEQGTAFWVKFFNLGSGHFPMHFIAYVAFPQNVTNCIQSLEYLINDQNVFVYACLASGFVPLEYYVGMNADTVMKEYLDEVEAVYQQIENNKPEAVEMNIDVSKFTHEQVIIDLKVRKSTQKSMETTDILQEKAGIVNNPKSDGKEITSAVENETRKFPEVDTICENFKTQFTFDEDVNCMSETEIHKIPVSKCRLKSTCSDVENCSWIVNTRNAKKARRKKKARDKKLLKSDENDGSADPENRGIANTGSCSEAIGIESKYSRYSMMSRSILKKSRSYSESSGDELGNMEYSCSLSVDDINISSDSYSHSATKKTVTFNDVISKKLYSSDISILEQRKRTKRRFQRKERKASDSDNSETESAETVAQKRESIRIHNENLHSEKSEIEFTSLSESGGESSDDQSDNPDAETKSQSVVPCSKRNHKRRGKKSARKNAFTAKYNFYSDD